MSNDKPTGPSWGLGKGDSNFQASEELKARVIVAYEQALRDGLPPSSALAAMLEWAAEECARVHADLA